jgi:CRP-like cAMP-binding protein
MLTMARATDPITSHQAAAQAEASGSAGCQRHKCLLAVRERPGMTSAEVAIVAGVQRHTAARRLPELRGNGLVRNGEKRDCQVCGTASMTWWAVTP